MRMHWWQSIRWRLALASVTVVILATAIMTLSSILAIAHYYSKEQQQNLKQIAVDNAQRIGMHYTSDQNLVTAFNQAFPLRSTNRALANTGLIRGSQENYLFLVFNQANRRVYPPLKQVEANNPLFWRDIFKNLYDAAVLHKTTGYGASLYNALLQADKGTETSGDIGPGYLRLFPRLFIVEPIRSGEFINNTRGWFAADDSSLRCK